jgi:predicted RNA methylase
MTIRDPPGAALKAQLLKAAEVSDAELDALLPVKLRLISDDYWTPIAVAALAAEWLTETGIRRVADVGSGPGKFCIVGAFRTDAEFVGIEHRQALVQVAKATAQRLGLADRARFVHARATFSDLLDFRALYLFNPFGENLRAASRCLDQTIELSESRYREDVELMEQVLRALPPGSRVVTYHGFGGQFPPSFRMTRERALGEDVLQLWVKAA